MDSIHFGGEPKLKVEPVDVDKILRAFEEKLDAMEAAEKEQGRLAMSKLGNNAACNSRQ